MEFLADRFAGVKRFYCENIAFDAEKRHMTYQIMAAQLEQGIPAARACTSIIGTKLHESIKILARAGVKASDRGDLVMSGWRGTGYIPPSEIAILEVAEERNALQEAFLFLLDPKRMSVSFVKAALLPAAQSILYFTVSLALVMYSETFFLNLPMGRDAATNTLAFKYSSWINDYGLFIGIGLFLFVSVMLHGRKNWVGTKRRLLTFFGHDWIYKLGLEYSLFASDLYRQGASHSRVLEISRTILPHGKYVDAMIDRVLRETVGQGEPYAPSLAGTLLPDEYADFLGQFAPEDNPARNARGFDSIANMLHAILASRYRRIGSLLTTGCLTATCGHVVLAITSMYGIFTDVQSFY